MKKRMFIAIEIPLKIKNKIIELQNELKKKIAGKWIAINNMHLTLIFLGEVEKEKLPSIKLILKTLKTSQFNLKVRNLGGFPNLKRPHVLWIGIERSNKLLEIQNHLYQKLKEKKFRIEDRKFIGHLTLARIRSKINSKYLEKFEQIDLGEFKVEEIVLFRSELTSSGANHQKCFEIELKPEKF